MVNDHVVIKLFTYIGSFSTIAKKRSISKMNLYEYYKIKGSDSLDDLADRLEEYDIHTSSEYLYKLALKKRNITPIFAIGIHKCTQGVIPYFESCIEIVEKVWPSDMFKYHEEWKRTKK